jgi:hypothetical protein
MKYCLNTKTCIFSRYTENKFALSSQEYKICRNGKCVCPKKFINKTKNSYPLKITFDNLELCIYDVVLQKDIIYFYFETDNPDSIILDKIYKDKKFEVLTCGNNQKPKCNKYVPSVQECSLLSTPEAYFTQIEINGQPLVVALDSGSSILGVPTDPYIELKPKDVYGNPLPTYKPAKDKCVKTTDYLTYIQYETGSWGGSNLISKIKVGNKNLNYIQFGAAYFDPNTESPIYRGGIMGLSFTYNNKYKIDFEKLSFPPTKEMLTQQFWDEQNKKPKTTYSTFMDYYGEKYSKYSQKFGIWVQRCIGSNTKNKEIAKQDPTNYGKFILGGGETNTNLYKGELSTIPVMKTPGNNAINPGNEPIFIFYTIQLNNFKINNENINIPKEKFFTFIDSGTTSLFFPKYFYEPIKNIFTSINIPLNCDGTGNFWDKYTFEYIFYGDVDINDICLKYWPTFELPLTDKDENIKIFKISPENYWNTTNGLYFFFINFGLTLNTIVLGHPFLCENYCVFDYGQKQVKIAPRK